MLQRDPGAAGGWSEIGTIAVVGQYEEFDQDLADVHGDAIVADTGNGVVTLFERNAGGRGSSWA